MLTTWGPVRGGCGHLHRTLLAAVRCQEADRYGCSSQGGYSDREVRYVRDRPEVRNYDVTQGPGRSLPIDETYI